MKSETKEVLFMLATSMKNDVEDIEDEYLPLRLAHEAGIQVSDKDVGRLAEIAGQLEAYAKIMKRVAALMVEDD